MNVSVPLYPSYLGSAFFYLSEESKESLIKYFSSNVYIFGIWLGELK